MLGLLHGGIAADRDYPARTFRLETLRRVLLGTIYDILPHEFHDERNGAGEYVPLRDRRPSVRTNLCRVIAEDSVAMLFGEGRFPAIDCADLDVRAAIEELVKDTRLPAVMAEAALRGSIGSVAILMRELRGRLHWTVLDAVYLTPAWQPDAPDTLASVRERYKVRGTELRAQGYTIADTDLHAEHWFERLWDGQAETWFIPRRVVLDRDKPPVIDTARTVRHGLGFVPMVWVRNLPGGDDVDGACTFRPAVETVIEIDYLLSQGGRGLKYSSDPTLLIKEPAAPEGDIVKGGGNALVVSEKGDAKLLEIGGTASAALLEHVARLREAALESVHGMRGSPDKMTTAQSGRAIELLHQPLIWLTDRLRQSYGEGALLTLLDMARRVSHLRPLRDRRGKPVPPIAEVEPIALRWPAWFPASPEDLQAQASTLQTLVAAELMARATATRTLAAEYDIEDTEAERALIEAEAQAADARAAEQAKALAAAKPTPITT